MRKVFVILSSALVIVAFVVGSANAHPQHKPARTYTQQVIARTVSYPPCVTALQTRSGRIAYFDTVADSYDDDGRRSVNAQVRYVKQACRNLS